MSRGVSVVSAGALLVFLVATAWLGRLEKGEPPGTEVMLEGGVPATFYLPESGSAREAFLDPPPLDELPPAVVMMHGFSGDRASMSGIARRIALSGFAVLNIDARGHGQNRNPITRSWATGDAFYPDLAAAVDYLRVSPHVDGSRIAVMGHSMGGGASLDYATRDSGIAAAVIVSGAWRLEGPYRPNNALFLYAAGDLERIRSRSQTLAARLLDVGEVERNRTYGNHADGSALRVVEIAGVNHQTIVWSGATVAEIVAWLDASFGRERGDFEVPDDPRAAVLPVLVLAMLFILPGLGRAIGRIVPSMESLPDAGRGRGLALLALVVVSTTPLLAAGPPGRIVSVDVGDVVVSHFALAGIALLVILALRGDGALAAQFRGAGRALLGAGVGVIAVFVMMHPIGVIAHSITLTPERMVVFALAVLGIWPLSLALQVLLRRGSPLGAVLFSIAGRAVVLGGIAAGVAAGVLSGVVLFMLPSFVIVFALFEVLAGFLYASSRNLLAISLIDAGWLALIIAAIFPIRI